MFLDGAEKAMFTGRGRPRLAWGLSVFVAAACLVTACAHGQVQVSERDQGFVPYADEPINGKMKQRLQRRRSSSSHEPRARFFSGQKYMKAV
jgi:hypothetical protein